MASSVAGSPQGLRCVGLNLCDGLCIGGLTYKQTMSPSNSKGFCLRGWEHNDFTGTLEWVRSQHHDLYRNSGFALFYRSFIIVATLFAYCRDCSCVGVCCPLAVLGIFLLKNTPRNSQNQRQGRTRPQSALSQHPRTCL